MEKNLLAPLAERFRNPPKGFRPAMMWFWNDYLVKEEITAQLEAFRSKGIEDFFIHPLSGAEYDYLSDEFFDAIRYAVQEAKRLGLSFWIYDEYNWPSGIAGGALLRDHPEYRAKTLNCRSFSVRAGSGLEEAFVDGRFLRAECYGVDGSSPMGVDISHLCRIVQGDRGFEFCFENRFCAPVTVYVYSVALQNYLLPASRFSSRALFCHGYVDPLKEEPIRGFIDYTHEQYKKAVGEEFGKTVKGVFTDEICVGFSLDVGNGRVPWTDGLEELYRQRYGQDLLPYLRILTEVPVTAEEKQVRCRFWELLTERMNTCHLKQVADWCKKEGLIYTGHFYGEESPFWWLYQSGDIFEQLKELTIPGMDSIFSIPRIEDENFNLAVKLLASCGRFYKKDRLLCETFSGSGFSLRFPQMRRIVNRLMTLGINMIQYMGAYESLDGGRKEMPLGYRAHFGRSNPLFRHLDQFGDYVSRVQSLSAATKPCGRVLLMCSMSSVACAVNGNSKIFESYYYLHQNFPEGKLDRTFIGVAEALLRMNVEFDLCSDGMAGDVTVQDGCATLYGGDYDTVILPEAANPPAAVLAMVRRLSEGGVKVIWVNALPKTDVTSGVDISSDSYTDSVYIQQDFESLSLADPRWQKLLEPHFPQEVRTLGLSHTGGIFSGIRRGEGGTVVFLCNDRDSSVTATAVCPRGTVFLDPEDGNPVPTEEREGKTVLTFGPYQMLVAFLGEEHGLLPLRKDVGSREGIPLRYEDLRFDEGNVSPLIWEILDSEGSVEWVRCESRLPAGDRLLHGGSLFLRARFTAETVPEPLHLFLETRGLLSCRLNGVSVLGNLKSVYRWGPRNGECEVSSLVRRGENEILAEVEVPKDYRPFALPYGFLRGDFSSEEGNLCSKEAGKLPGIPALFGDMTYLYTVTLTEAQAASLSRLSVESNDALSLTVNGTYVGRRLWSPFRFDLKNLLRAGENRIEITATLPFHNAFRGEVDAIPVGIIGIPKLFS